MKHKLFSIFLLIFLVIVIVLFVEKSLFHPSNKIFENIILIVMFLIAIFIPYTAFENKK